MQNYRIQNENNNNGAQKQNIPSQRKYSDQWACAATNSTHTITTTVTTSGKWKMLMIKMVGRNMPQPLPTNCVGTRLA